MQVRQISYGENERKVGFKIGSSVCNGETNVSSIEEEFKDGFLIAKVYVNDKHNSVALWKKIMVTQNNIVVTEYDWKKIIESHA